MIGCCLCLSAKILFSFPDSSKHTEELRALLEHVTKSKNEKEAEVTFFFTFFVWIKRFYCYKQQFVHVLF